MGFYISTRIAPELRCTTLKTGLTKSHCNLRLLSLAREFNFVREIGRIAANDTGFIPAMEALNATIEEIREIRLADRRAQGVTEVDEQLAEQSILQNLINDRGITIVKSLTSKFSPITDRLYPCNQLLIYTENELTIYGVDTSILIDQFADLSAYWTTYSGGGKKGYWGISGGKITKKLIKKIIKAVTKCSDPLSSHIFLFPFKYKIDAETDENRNQGFYDYIKKKWNLVIDEDEPEEDADLRIRTEAVTLYNEKKYFHDFVHPVIFGDSEHKDNLQINNIGKTVDLIYRITVKRKKSDQSESDSNEDSNKIVYENYAIDLNLKKVTLNTYNDGIGIFSFHLDYFPESALSEKNQLSNVLLINQKGRRLYPPFLDLRYGDFNIGEVNSELEGTKRRELPESISILDLNETICFENWDEFQISENGFNALNKSTFVPRHILYFLNLEEVKPNLQLALDDRMFVMSWLGARQLAEEFRKQKMKLKKEEKKFGYVVSDLCKRQPGRNEAGISFRDASDKTSLTPRRYNGYRYLNNDFWYQYVFVDGGSKTCQNDVMQEQLLSRHTYDRWTGYNTLYGITRYSFVLLSAPLKELKSPGINAAFLPDHIQTIYFRMVSLVLAQRAMVLDFSKRIGDIKISIENEDKQVQKEALSLYKAYRDFINNVFHREITAQEQGIELYDMLQEHLRVEKQAKELEKEFDEMNRLINLVGENQSKARMKVFTILTGVFLIPTFILNLLKNRKFDDLKPIESWSLSQLAWPSVYLLVFLTGFAFFFTSALLSWNDKKKKKRWLLLLSISCALLIFYLVTFQLSISFLWITIYTVILIALVTATLITPKLNK